MDENSKRYHKCESWDFCLPINEVASFQLGLMHFNSNVGGFGQISGPKANLTHQAIEKPNKMLPSVLYVAGK